MKRFRLNLRRPRTQLHLAAFIFLFMLAAAPSVAHGMGLRFWDDANSNGGQCDVLGYLGNATKCSDNNYNVALVSVMTAPVPKGPTTVHIVYDNLPLKADGSIDGSAGLFTNNNLHFDIQGDKWCPTYSGASGVNKKDVATAGDFATANDLPTGISTGTTVTDYVINRADGTERALSGGTYRNSAQFCDTSGANFTQVVNVKPADLQHQKGFPPGTWYVELLARPSESLIANGTNQATNCGTKYYNADCSVRCSASSPSNCQGISNKFRVVLNTSETGSSYYHSVSGSSINSTGNDFNVTFTNVNWTWDSGIAGDTDRHYSVVYRFGADCSVLNNNGALATKVLFYDIDDSRNAGDIQKALLVRIDSDGNTYTLDSGGYITNAKSGAPGTWHQRAASWSQDYSDSDATRIDQAGTNRYTSANFNARTGDKYKLYIYDIRGDLVDQIGAPFDSVYFDNPCSAKLNPGVRLSLASGTDYSPGSVVNADASIENPDDTNAGAAWMRRFWIAPPGAQPTQYNGEPYLTLDGGGQGFYDTGTTVKYVQGGDTVDTTDPAPGNLQGTWSYTIPNSVQDGSWICTTMYLKPSTLDPPGTEIVGASNPAIKCRPIIGVALPYLSVLGGDVAAGPGFGASCTPDNTAGIITNSNPAAPYNGSSAQLAALALANIALFTSSKYQTAATPNAWVDSLTGAAPAAGSQSALTFANTAAAKPSGSYGGHLGLSQTGAWCVPDYFANTPDGSARTNGNESLSGDTGNYHYTGTYTINSSLIGINNHLTVKVTGDVYITGNITYAANPGSLAAMPSLQVLATGNIYVDPGVTEIDGFFVAQNGDFITCGNAGGAFYSYATCNKPLTVVGGVAAKRVVPNRTYGDQSGAKGPASPAETFQFSPSLWLPGISGGGAVGPWQSITSLPPIL